MQVQFSFMKKSYVHWKRKFKLFVTYCSQFYCAHLQTYNISDEKYNKVLVAYNNVLRFLLCLPRHCSASHMFVRIMLSNQICDDLLNLKLEVGIRPRPCSASHMLVCIMLSNQICDDLLNLKLEVGIRRRPCSASHMIVYIVLL